MKFTLVAALAIATTAYGAPRFETRQEGSACFVGTVTLAGLPATVNTCGTTSPTAICQATETPITFGIPLLTLSLTLASGVRTHFVDFLPFID